MRGDFAHNSELSTAGVVVLVGDFVDFDVFDTVPLHCRFEDGFEIFTSFLLQSSKCVVGWVGEAEARAVCNGVWAGVRMAVSSGVVEQLEKQGMGAQ